MNCSQCGRLASSLVKFCSNCGNSLVVEESKKRKPQEPNRVEAEKSQNRPLVYTVGVLIALTAIALGASQSNGPVPTMVEDTASSSEQSLEPDFENMSLRQLCTEYPLVAQTLGRSCDAYAAAASSPGEASSDSQKNNNQTDGEIDYFRTIDEYQGDVLEDCITYQTIFDGAIDYSPHLQNEGMRFRRHMETTFSSLEFARVYLEQSEAIYNDEPWTWPETLAKFATVCYKEAGFTLEGN